MIETTWLWLVDQITTNDVFAGLVGLSVVGSLMLVLRGVPGILWTVLLRQGTVELTIHNTDQTFQWINSWLALHPYASRARRLQLISGGGGGEVPAEPQDENEGEAEHRMVPGAGLHWFWHHGRLVAVTHNIDVENSRGQFLRESYKLRVLGRRQALLRGLVLEARAIMLRDETIPVHVWIDSYWREAARKQPRPLDSVVLPEGQVRALVRDAEWFFGAAGWYADRGVPYRRGYLFSGPPGTGKTSLVMALASHFRLPLYTLNLGGLWSDSSLQNAFTRLPRKAILLIEDIDAASAAKARRVNPEKANGEDKDGMGVTLSGLLNTIDGVAASDGRLLIMTTNHPSKLDPSLTRAGRADRHETFGPLGAPEAARMFERFYPGGDAAEFITGLALPLPAADLQARLIERGNGGAG